MIRKIIHIDEGKCTGCAACAKACHEGAIVMAEGKAKLIRDDYCDGLGDCLPSCPAGAITITEREAALYDAHAVMQAKAKKDVQTASAKASGAQTSKKSCLSQWPVQIKLVAHNAPYFNDADVLIAASCTAYACGDFHEKFIKDHITLIGCPKLDNIDYSQKLSLIIQSNNIKSIAIARMEVPCCGGLVNAVKKALQSSGKDIPCNIATIATDGKIIE